MPMAGGAISGLSIGLTLLDLFTAFTAFVNPIALHLVKLALHIQERSYTEFQYIVHRGLSYLEIYIQMCGAVNLCPVYAQ